MGLENRSVFILFCCLFGLLACGEIGVGYNQYTLNYDMAVTIDKDKKLKFTALVEDSRCPVDVECVDAGSVTVQLRANDAGKDTFYFNMVLLPDLETQRDTTIYDRYRIELTSVLPERYSDDDITDADYQVRLAVQRLR